MKDLLKVGSWFVIYTPQYFSVGKIEKVDDVFVTLAPRNMVVFKTGHMTKFHDLGVCDDGELIGVRKFIPIAMITQVEEWTHNRVPNVAE